MGTVSNNPASESVQKQPDHQKTHPQNTDLDALNPTILFIRRETAGKAGTTFGFHPTKLSVGPTTEGRGGFKNSRIAEGWPKFLKLPPAYCKGAERKT